MKKKLCMMLLLSVVAASAAPIDYATWTGAQGLSTYSMGVITASSAPPGSWLNVDSVDGLGINRPNVNDQGDEIDGVEILTISFSSPVFLSSFLLTDLYDNVLWKEDGWYSINGGPQNHIVAATGQYQLLTNGLLSVNVGALNVSSVAFTSARGDSYSLRQMELEFSQVPEPGTFVMLGLGLVALATVMPQFRRRKQ